LRRLQGRKILLNFWTSWSSPCLEQLRYLDSLQAESAENGTIILAVNDGEDPEKAAEFLRKNGLTLRMVADEQRTIALAYGIRCWPTTVAIDEYGNISGEQLGVK
jgi:thiol-disulfide isomerase/thioredoxin